MSETIKYSVPAFEHGLDLMELLLGCSEPLSQKAIADRSGKPVSSVFRLLNCLEQRGYAQRDPRSGEYRPTLQLYSLAQLCPAHRRFRDLAATPMAELAQSVGESCHLSILDGGRVRVVYNQPSPHMHSLNISETVTYSAVNTTAGKLLLAHLPSETRQGWLDNDSDYRAFRKSQRAAFDRQLRTLEENDELVIASEPTPGVLDVDRLIPAAWMGNDAVLGTPCILKWSKKSQQSTLLPAVRKACQQIAAIFEKESHV
ncbi:IclR family transcriptional regulator [Novipirellula artificiosorum]|uniref:Putative HTH-type transcriptional regulator RhmR n=1 Tax=Novipirellula artificiosorum TaxID=2528016 RepID=A0A5C6E5B5_9BACT|nr:helix-turn-helix domain-containing protein [Novipirellula artificiosorum]TWU42791.1 putative HTH-type transcriptional regulator RhmR [Novipirellula artificiosorum]